MEKRIAPRSFEVKRVSGLNAKFSFKYQGNHDSIEPKTYLRECNRDSLKSYSSM